MDNSASHSQRESTPTGETMFAMVFDGPGQPLRPAHLPVPVPRGDEVLIRASACGVCRTDLHILDGDLVTHKHGLIPGHEIVGRIVKLGSAAVGFAVGERVGVPWLGGTCGHCPYCTAARENLCNTPVFTGYDRDGGYAEYAIADSAYLFRIPEKYDDMHAAPLLCAGLIGYRAYAMIGEARRIGLYGFGAAAHIIAQVARQPGSRVNRYLRLLARWRSGIDDARFCNGADDAVDPVSK